MRGALGIVGVAILGCTGELSDTGNARLGIAAFQVTEAADRSTVIGVDRDGAEVARLELTHGAFTLSAYFAADHDDPDVVGRKLDVSVLGQEMKWETEGFDPVLQLPAPPSSRWAVDAFLRDPHVERLLGRWQIGFGPPAEAPPRYPCHFNGTRLLDCSGEIKCPTVTPFTNVPSTCGGNFTEEMAKEIIAYRIHQRPDERYYYWKGSVHDQSWISQWCPARGDTQAFYAEKACPDAPWMISGDRYPTSCGMQRAGNCLPCPTYPHLGVEKIKFKIHDAGWSDGDEPVSEICISYCGDGVCDHSETCGSCEADCAARCAPGLTD